MLLCLCAVTLSVPAACSSGGSSSLPTTAASTIRTVTVLPKSGTVRLDGRIYTVADVGQTLQLGDISVRLKSIGWRHSVHVKVTPPGTTEYAVVTLTLTNRAATINRVGLTQFWLLDANRHPFLAAGGAGVPRPLVGLAIAAGGTVTGQLVFPVPARFGNGTLLVYQFADAAAIAKAAHVGIARFGSD
jgi:Domain of unknown function (DUF4352)